VKGWIWYFAEIGAFQSVVEFEILSLPVWAGAERGGFVEDGAGIKRHRQAAERLGSSIVHHLRQRQADGRTRRLHALKQQELYCSTTRTDCRAAGRLTGRSGADLGNIIPGMGTPVPDCSKLVELVPIVDPDYQEGGLRRAGSQGHSPPQGAGTDPKPERQFDPTHDPYFDSSAGDIAAAGQSSGAQVDDCQYEE